MKERSGHSLFRSVILLAALVFIAISVTFAWFTDQATSEAEPFNGNVVRANSCQVSVDGLTWEQEIVIAPGPSVLFPLTGDGSTLYQPVYTEVTTVDPETGVGRTQLEMTGLKGLSNDADTLKEYAVVQDMYLRTDGGVYLTLSPDSYVIPAAEPNIGNGSNIDKNDVAGAIRVALLKNVGGTYQTLFIWAPNSTFELVTPEGETFPTEVDHAGAVEEDYQLYVDGAYTDIPTAGQASGYQKVGDTYYFWGDLSLIEDLYKIAIDEDPPVVGEMPGQYRLLIWLEGTDRECHQVLAEGQVAAEIEFKTEFKDAE